MVYCELLKQNLSNTEVNLGAVGRSAFMIYLMHIVTVFAGWNKTGLLENQPWMLVS